VVEGVGSARSVDVIEIDKRVTVFVRCRMLFIPNEEQLNGNEEVRITSCESRRSNYQAEDDPSSHQASVGLNDTTRSDLIIKVCRRSIMQINITESSKLLRSRFTIVITTLRKLHATTFVHKVRLNYSQLV
jgi:hypothetical protein